MGGFRIALFLGGLDPSGGAGVLRDVAVVSGLDIHSMVIPMAETIQNGLTCANIGPPCINPIERIESLKPHLIEKWGVKLSMFHNCRVLHDVLPQIHQLGPLAAIWDPIMAPTNGVALHTSASIKEVVGLLSGNQWVVSPNIPEARILADLQSEPLEAVAKKLMDMGMKSVWIRGGHGTDNIVQDLWCDDNGLEWLTPYDRLKGDPRGTGCTVTSAWLAFRLNGKEPVDAAEAAIQYTRRAWEHLHIPGNVGRLTFPPRVNR